MDSNVSKVSLQEYASKIEDLDNKLADLFRYLYNKCNEGDELAQVVIILEIAAAMLTGPLLLSDQGINAFAEYYKELSIKSRDFEISQSEK